MAYICTQCGKIISNSEYKKRAKNNNKIGGLSIFMWVFIIFCFISMILAPLALIILLLGKKQQPQSVCPYCGGRETLIPHTTPIGNKIIKENYSNEELENIKLNDKIIPIEWYRLILVLIIVCIIFIIGHH